jgi:hypothetical protein
LEATVNEPLTDEQLREIEARANAAHPGPWRRGTEREDHGVWGVTSHRGQRRGICLMNTSVNFRKELTPTEAFVIASRTDVPALLATVAALRAKLRASLEAHEHADFRAEKAEHDLEQSRAWESGWKVRAEEAEAEIERLRAACVITTKRRLDDDRWVDARLCRLCGALVLGTTGEPHHAPTCALKDPRHG